METSNKNKHSVDTLLALMSQQLENIIAKIEKVEEKLDTKVDLVHFEKLERSFEEHKKETMDKISEHTVKISIGAGILTALSWATHLLK